MESKYDYRLKLTDEEESILQKAIELLKPFNNEEVSRMTTYFEEVDEDGDCLEDLDAEYDCCNNDVCIISMSSNLKNEYPEKNISHRFYHNDGDHERIERCQICNKPLNEGMTWISSEFDHYDENKPSYEDIKNYSNISFDLTAVFQSFPSNDEEVSDYALHQKTLGNKEPLISQIKRIDNFKNRVLGLAEHVILIINNSPIELKGASND